MTVPDGVNPSEALTEYEIGIDFIPEMTEQEVELWLHDQPTSPREALRSVVKGPVAEALIRTALEGQHADGPNGQHDDASFAGQHGHEQLTDLNGLIAGKIKDWRFQVKNLRGWQYAQVTKGGVPLSEVDPDTMESKIIPNLFFSGEVLDYDGPCGGFNLQWAWASGLVAGELR